MKIGKVVRKRESFSSLSVVWRCVDSAVLWDAAAVRKVGVVEEVWEDVHPGLLD